MQVHLKPETESRLQELAAKTGRAPDELVEDAMAGYLQELAQIREVLDGRFKVVEPIGSGGMGRVYKAVQAPLNRAVALKILDYNYGPGRDATFLIR